jgi:hypothetical protein
MEIKVCGPGCASCEKTQKIVEAAVAAKGVSAAVIKVKDFQEIAKLGIFLNAGSGHQRRGQMCRPGAKAERGRGMVELMSFATHNCASPIAPFREMITS